MMEPGNFVAWVVGTVCSRNQNFLKATHENLQVDDVDPNPFCSQGSGMTWACDLCSGIMYALAVNVAS
eukprot:4645536-Amphidinium_carterae.1